MRRAGAVGVAGLALILVALLFDAAPLFVPGIALIVLPPLALAKRRTAARLGSHALRGDSSLTAIGAATALIALIGLALFHAFGWWWADRAAALIVAALAASEGYEVLRGLRANELD